MLLETGLNSFRDHLHSAPNLHDTLHALRTQLADLLSRLYISLQLTSFSSVYAFVTRWFMKIGKICIEALDWLLLPRMVWTITVRHVFALLVLYFVKVFYQVALLPVIRSLYRFARPFFINKEYLKQEKYLQSKLDNATVYPEWKKAASELDRLQGEILKARKRDRTERIGTEFEWLTACLFCVCLRVRRQVATTGRSRLSLCTTTGVASATT